MQEKIEKALMKSSEIASKTKIPFEIPNHANPLNLVKFYQKVVVWANSEIDNVEEQCSLKNVCSRGCNYCCRQAIPVAPIETIIIMRYIEKFDKAIQKDIYTKCVNISNILANTELNDKILMRPTQVKFVLAEYFKLNLLCPFVGNEGECMIYDVRPSNCWSYRSYGKAADCNYTYNPDDAIKYEDWESIILPTLLTLRNSKKGLMFLPNAIKEAWEDAH